MNRTKLLLSSLALGGGVFLLDRWTKNFFMGRPTQEVIGTIFQTTTHQNFGLMANIPVPLPLIISITVIVAAIVLYFLIQSIKKQETVPTLAFALLLSGALGNIFDRITLGYVFDWMMFFQTSILNIADISVGVGIVLLLTQKQFHGSGR